MKNLTTKKIVFVSLVTFTLLGCLYSSLAPKIYTSKSHVALFRMKIEDPDYNTDESRNRWIWIRDGLNVKSALVTDSVIDKISQSNSTAKELRSQFNSKSSYYEYMKKLIDVQFTGADENNFIVEVKAPAPKLAYELNIAVFDRIKYLAIVADQKKFDDLLNDIKLKAEEVKSDQNAYAFYQDKIKKMTFNHLVEQKQRENSFEIISPPALVPDPIWPNPKLIIVMTAFIGLMLGLALDFLLKNMNRNHA